ncbi:cytochrome P450 [Streptomyces sp. NPDC057301]|uniref:cytochrome P450 n=1 Tax=Streptomyces sp. NPDC057301 TaxID=3346093 RepID=UPI003642541C
MATVELPSGDKATYLTRYDHVKALLADPRFTRPTAEDGAARIAPEGAGGPAADGTTTLALPDRGEPHLRWRRQVGKYFTAKRMTALHDLISMVIRESEGEGQGLTDEELLGTAMGLLVAGHETTANMIGKMVAMLLADRTRWERLLADPALVRTAVDEALRFDANLGFGIRRYLTEDVEVDGELLPGGTTVVCSMPAANRDERVFADADDMVLSRSPNPHLTFGAGPHACLGQSLARTELQVTLEVLLSKLPTLQLDVSIAELQRVEGLLVGGLRTVPVRW